MIFAQRRFRRSQPFPPRNLLRSTDPTSTGFVGHANREGELESSSMAAMAETNLKHQDGLP